MAASKIMFVECPIGWLAWRADTRVTGHGASKSDAIADLEEQLSIPTINEEEAA